MLKTNIQGGVIKVAKISFDEVIKKVKEKNLIRDIYEYSRLWKGKILTVIGIRTLTTRAIFQSHDNIGNETIVDKETINGVKRAVFTSRKQKAVERRAHIRLFRKFNPQYWSKAGINDCIVPEALCRACPNCTLFGSMVPGRDIALASRIRYCDSFSIEPVEQCVATGVGDDGESGMAVGNMITSELVSQTLFYYEYIRPGTRFPFVTVILDPDPLDIAGFFAAHKLANSIGFGTYSTNHGKFKTDFLAIGFGMPNVTPLDLAESKGEIPEEPIDGELVLLSDEAEIFAQEAVEKFGELASKIDPQRYVKQLQGRVRKKRGEKEEKGK